MMISGTGMITNDMFVQNVHGHPSPTIHTRKAIGMYCTYLLEFHIIEEVIGLFSSPQVSTNKTPKAPGSQTKTGFEVFEDPTLRLNAVSRIEPVDTCDHSVSFNVSNSNSHDDVCCVMFYVT